MTTEEKHHISPGRWTILALVLVFVLGVLAWATMEQRKSIYKTAEELGGCKTFIECVQKAGLSGVLEKDGPFSVFIPTDDAFSKLSSEELTQLLNNKSALTALLLYHMVPKKMNPTELENAKDCLTCTVPQTSIACSETSYGKGKSIQSAVPCTNGVIYLIDSVQVPPFMSKKNADNTESITIIETVGNVGSGSGTSGGTGTEASTPKEGGSDGKGATGSVSTNKTASPVPVTSPAAQPNKASATPAAEPKKETPIK